jgi:BASS family bile acid:Na+ symporter
MSNLITYLGRGNTPLSISLTAVTTLGCLATTPLLLELFASTHLPEDFSMPAGNIVREIAFVLLLPLGAGMFVGTRFPSVRDSFSRWCIRGSLAAIGLIIIGSIGSGRVDPGAHGAIAVLVMAVLPILAQVAALLLSIAARLSPGDALALGIEVTVRNTNLGLLIAASLFPPGVAGAVGDGVFFVALLYGGFALLVAVPLTLSGRRRFRRATSPEGAVTAT